MAKIANMVMTGAGETTREGKPLSIGVIWLLSLFFAALELAQRSFFTNHHLSPSFSMFTV